MLRIFNNLSFRLIILASLGAPVLLLWVAGYYAWDNWRTYGMLKATIENNAMADRIIAAASQQAIERGVAAGLLSAQVPAGEDARRRLVTLREVGDSAWREAIAIADRQQAAGTAREGFVIARRKAEEAYGALQQARQRVDASLSAPSAGRGITALEWITLITDFIDKAARMRLFAFGENSVPPDIAYANLTAKHNVWLASEFAGQERAMVTALINGNAPVPPETLQRLAALRQIVEINIGGLQFLRTLPDTPRPVVASLEDMDKQFLGSFQDVRKRFYAEAKAATPAAGDRHYSMSGAEWFDHATAAINSLIKVSEAYSAVGNETANGTARFALAQVIGYVATFVGMIAATAIATLLLLSKLRRLDRLRGSMAQFATGQGDLTHRLEADTADEIGETSAAFNRFAEKLQEIVRETRAVAVQLAAASEKLTAASEHVSTASRAQSEVSSATASAVQQMTVSVGQVAEHTKDTLADSRHAGALAEDGARIVRQVADEMQSLATAVTDCSRCVEGLGERSREVGGIVVVIREIAEQTNLLALNAAIEAARAGEQGRGFAVVADEVRKLAERTGAATVDISRMIETIRNDTDAAVQGMHASGNRVVQNVSLASQAAEALAKIRASTLETVARVNEIAAATQEQSLAGNAIAKNIEHIAQMAERNDEAAGETVRDVQEQRMLAERLHGLICRFNA